MVTALQSCRPLPLQTIGFCMEVSMFCGTNELYYQWTVELMGCTAMGLKPEEPQGEAPYQSTLQRIQHKPNLYTGCFDHCFTM